MKKVQHNEIIFARTNADLINQLTGSTHKAWMKSSAKLGDGKLLWMIELGNFVTSSHWINQMLGSDKISEKHVGEAYEFEGHGTWIDAMQRRISWDDADRVVFQKIQSPYGRRYIFRGVFRLDKKSCSEDENVWVKIADEYMF